MTLQRVLWSESVHTIDNKLLFLQVLRNVYPHLESDRDKVDLLRSAPNLLASKGITNQEALTLSVNWLVPVAWNHGREMALADK